MKGHNKHNQPGKMIFNFGNQASKTIILSHGQNKFSVTELLPSPLLIGNAEGPFYLSSKNPRIYTYKYICHWMMQKTGLYIYLYSTPHLPLLSSAFLLHYISPI